jgi:hypothetical protein
VVKVCSLFRSELDAFEESYLLLDDKQRLVHFCRSLGKGSTHSAVIGDDIYSRTHLTVSTPLAVPAASECFFCPDGNCIAVESSTYFLLVLLLQSLANIRTGLPKL